MFAHTPVTPAGNPVTVAPVALTVAYEISAMSEFTHTVCAFVPIGVVNVMELVGFTNMVKVVGVPVQYTVPLV